MLTGKNQPFEIFRRVIEVGPAKKLADTKVRLNERPLRKVPPVAASGVNIFL
jgi:hypothetical protein